MDHVFGMHPERCSLRLPGYDYRRPDPYFVTICTKNRECLFGDVLNGEMLLNSIGQTVQACWRDIPAHFSNVILDAFVVMPNHIHGVIWIVDGFRGIRPAVGMTHASSLRERIAYSRVGHHDAMPARGPQPGSVGAIIGSFKSAATRLVNKSRKRSGTSIWQYNFHERIIRSQASLERIRRYIEMNPLKWVRDRQNPNCRNL